VVKILNNDDAKGWIAKWLLKFVMVFFPFFLFYSAIVLVCQNNSEFHPHEKALG
jgi:hypothetical protein